MDDASEDMAAVLLLSVRRRRRRLAYSQMVRLQCVLWTGGMGQGKGEKGGEDLVKDEQLLPYRAATTLARGRHRRLIGSDDHVGESSSSSSSS